jgi:hypothetical protein
MGKNKKTKNNDVPPTSETPIIIKKDHTKSANIILMFIIVSIIICTVLVYFGLIYFPYTYHSAIVTQRINASMGSEFKIINMDSVVTFSTSSLSAQNPVDVTVKLFPRQEDLQNNVYSWYLADPAIYAVFPDSLDNNQTLFNKDIYQTGIVTLKKNSDSIDSNNDKYEGNGHIIYQFEGKYGYFFVTDHELRSHIKGKYEVLNSTEFNKRMTNDTLFPVGSSDFTTTIKTNNIVTALTLILIIFGMFEIRKELRRYLIRIITRVRG